MGDVTLEQLKAMAKMLDDHDVPAEDRILYVTEQQYEELKKPVISYINECIQEANMRLMLS